MIWIILLVILLVVLFILIPCVVTSSRVSREEEYDNIIKQLEKNHKNSNQ
ncbi:MAG: hypothetical protein RR585_07285 [Coprobacillus sp.]